MNDIKLSHNGDGTYDWSFTTTDVENVTGARQTISSVIHAIMLRYDELIQAPYQDKGCHLHEYVKLPYTPELQSMLKDTTVQTATSIWNITDAEVTYIGETGRDYDITLTVKRDDGLEVIINGS